MAGFGGNLWSTALDARRSHSSRQTQWLHGQSWSWPRLEAIAFWLRMCVEAEAFISLASSRSSRGWSGEQVPLKRWYRASGKQVFSYSSSFLFLVAMPGALAPSSKTRSP